MSDELAKLPETFFDEKLAEIAKVIPQNTITAEALARIMLTSMNRSPKLRGCTKGSIMECLFNCAHLGLIPNNSSGHCYVIPYGAQATIQVGFKGFAELAYRSGNVKLIQADSIHDGDQFEYLKGVGEEIKPFVKHCRSIGTGRSKQALLGAWASCELINGGVTIEIIDSDDIRQIRSMADIKSPAWKYFEDEMAKKAAVKRLLKLQQLSNMETLRKAIDLDNQSNGLLPGIDKPAPEEHKLVLTDEGMVGETVAEPEPEKPVVPIEAEEHEFSW